MYGLVNRALQDFVTREFGPEKWTIIRQKAGVNEIVFVSMESYPDDITYKLARVTSEVLGIPIDKALEAFGAYWVTYTAREGYGEMLNMCGGSLKEFMMNLNSLHARIRLSFPQLKPPLLKCMDIQDRSLILHYYSDRPGLAPMVIGLIKGLGKRFSVEVDISLITSKDAGADHDVFDVRW